MKSKNNPLSIKIIYYLTQFTFWVTILGAVLMLFFFTGNVTGLFSEDTETGLDVPVRLNVEETGTFTAYGKTYDVKIQDARGRFEFTGLPRKVYGFILVSVVILLAMLLAAIWYFRKFIINVYRGIYFDPSNISYLKRMAYSLFIIWCYLLVVSNISAGFIMSTTEFESISFAGTKSDSSAILFGALFIWVLSHIFSKGMQLEQEQELTI